MRALLACLLLTVPTLLLAGTPDLLWTFQGIEDVNAFASVPDANGDGVPDIVVETYDAGADGDHLYLLSGGDSGAPAVIWSVRPVSGASNGGGYGQECLVSCDDLSGDGFPDVLLGTAWGNRSVHAVDGLTGAVLWTFDTYDEPASGWIYAVRSLPDRTGDGRPEVVFGGGSDNHRGYLLDGGDGSVIWRFIGAGDALGYTEALTDMNGDEIADVLFCGWDNEHRVFCVSGAGEIAGQQIWSRDTGSSNHNACAIDDVTGDGVPEVVVGTWATTNQVLCLDGSDGSTVWTFHNGSSNYIMRLVATDDLDGDGYRDVAVGSWSNGLPVISGYDGSLIWISYAGGLNGGDFWTVAATGDLDGDGLGEVIGGSFDTKVYLFSGADGDTLWTYATGNRLYSVFGGPDLSGNGTPDVLGGTQYLSSGGRGYALEGGAGVTPVGDLPEAAGRALRGPGTVELSWRLDRPLPCVVDRLVAESGAKARASRRAVAEAFARGELDTRAALDAVLGDKAAGGERLTGTPLLPESQGEDGFRYEWRDPAAPAGATLRYRVSAILPEGGEVVLLELAPSGEVAPRPLLDAVRVAPNPFNPRCELQLELDRAATVAVEIHDLRGRCVAALGPEDFPAGPAVLRWDGRAFDGRALAAGVYLMRVTAGGESLAVKAALVR